MYTLYKYLRFCVYGLYFFFMKMYKELCTRVVGMYKEMYDNPLGNGTYTHACESSCTVVHGRLCLTNLLRVRAPPSHVFTGVIKDSCTPIPSPNFFTNHTCIPTIFELYYVGKPVPAHINHGAERISHGYYATGPP